MAEFKTAEQYVVDRLETTESELERLKKEYEDAVEKYTRRIDDLTTELVDAYDLLNMLRDFISVRNNDYFGATVYIDTIYMKEYPELVARIMEYYDIRPEEGENDA